MLPGTNGKPFTIVLEEDYFERGDILSLSDEGSYKVKVTSTPKMHWWLRFKKWMGWNYSWHYKVKVC